MAARLLLLCPGQGAQSPAMFDLARGDPHAAAFLEACGITEIDGAALFSNALAQPAIVAATLANWIALNAPGALAPALVAGYSIGELAAYGVAGALDPLDAVMLARRRAALMDGCRAGGDGAAVAQAMLAASGIASGRIEALLPRFGFYAAILTGDDSLVAGGPAQQREALAAALAAEGGHATMLPVEIASHTPYMRAAVAPFEELLRAAHMRDPVFPVLSGIAGTPVERADTAGAHLARQLAEPIRWKECMDACAEFGVTAALELGPGAALSRMLQSRHPHIACRSVSEFRSLDGVRGWLARHAD